ncbi:hypothetical protein M419DRAFT_87774 [Trichoderma reesei RUT C-30]|uniref:Uncharacterized protein n=1 Tax=Hypocrea jecorina (strain ATCC 56765 / BCRC 32924 / NRRL 11460 / Rut C-30) TaxID=1344414 RepID=A0A024S029_HYPJR|nr:hypothetical protein M419DRAFT_87774 [Trichoderma reesei RUT C-30]
MPEDIDKSLLERLQALRGSSSGASPGRAAAPIHVDVIERTKPATREDALAARLKSLRAADDGSAASPDRRKKAPTATTTAPQASSPSPSRSNTAEAKDVAYAEESEKLENDEDVDRIFSTDDQTLEELLGDVNPDETTPAQEEPSDEQVRALLEELSRAVPKDDDNAGGNQEDDRAGDSDDSDGEQMQAQVSDVIAQFQDEAAIDAARQSSKDDDDNETASAQKNRDQEPDQDTQEDGDVDLALPSLPPNLDDLSSFSPRRPSTTTAAKADAIDDITARIAALRAPAAAEEEDASFSLPSVPSSRPSAGDKPVRRLTSKTDYTDDDIDGWCTVCLDDATLQCLGCDDDPYCTRCWREMHVGPAAAFDDRSHKAVQFTRARKKDKQQKVAIGA